MSHWVLAGNRDGVFGTDNGDFVEQSVSDSAFNLLDLLNGLGVRKTVQEKVDVGGRTKLLMIVLTELPLR